MNTFSNSVAVLSQFNRSIKLNLVRFGAGRFGHVCEQTGKRLFFENSTRLDAAVCIASRYFTAQSHADCAFVNPRAVAHKAGLDMAIDFLLAAGFCRVEVVAGQRTLVIVATHDME